MCHNVNIKVITFPPRILATGGSCPSKNYRKLHSHTVTPPSRWWAVDFCLPGLYLCMCVFSRQSDKGNYYTAWSAMSAIVRKGLINKYSHPPRSVNCMQSLSYVHMYMLCIHTYIHMTHCSLGIFHINKICSPSLLQSQCLWYSNWLLFLDISLSLCLDRITRIIIVMKKIWALDKKMFWKVSNSLPTSAHLTVTEMCTTICTVDREIFAIKKFSPVA